MSEGCSTRERRRGPSAELQCQIDEAIAARTGKGYSGGSLPQRVTEDGQCNQCIGSSSENGSLSDSARSPQPQNHETMTHEPGSAPPGSQFEYLDHPADIILHSWGVDFPTALTNLAIAMFGYMTTLDYISINEEESLEHGGNIIAQGHDESTLVYAFLDEWLYNFHDSGFISKEIRVTEYNKSVWRIVSCGRGEVMDVRRHPQVSLSSLRGICFLLQFFIIVYCLSDTENNQNHREQR